MTNPKFSRIEVYRDIETLNDYKVPVYGLQRTECLVKCVLKGFDEGIYLFFIQNLSV